jgi:hypothetical protein
VVTHGVVNSQGPPQIVANAPKQSLRRTSRGILVGKGGEVYLKYPFHRSAQQSADARFVDAAAGARLISSCSAEGYEDPQVGRLSREGLSWVLPQGRSLTGNARVRPQISDEFF